MKRWLAISLMGCALFGVVGPGFGVVLIDMDTPVVWDADGINRAVGASVPVVRGNEEVLLKTVARSVLKMDKSTPRDNTQICMNACFDFYESVSDARRVCPGLCTSFVSGSVSRQPR